MIHYPKKVYQAIFLIVLSVVCATPICACYEFLNLNIRQEFISDQIFLTIFLFILLMFVLLNKRKVNLGYFFEGRKKIKNKLLIISLIILASFTFAIDIPISKVISNIFGNYRSINFFSDLHGLIGILILGPVCEEIVFRGIILKGFLTNYSPFKSILFSSIIFSLIHYKLNLIFGAFFIGLLLGYLFYLTRNLWLSIFFHFFANLLSALAGYIVYYNDKIAYSHKIYGNYTILIILVGLALLTISFIRLYKESKR